MGSVNVAAIILSAGKGTRMKSEIHKVLHPIGGRPMILHLMDKLDGLGVSRRVVVVGDKKEQIKDVVKGVQFCVQEPQRGTGHAVMASEQELETFTGCVLILYGDVPLVELETMENMIKAAGEKSLVVLGFKAKNPKAYGRLVKGEGGDLEAIVEASEANEETLKIDLCNSGIMAIDKALLFDLLNGVTNDNAKGEYYLTDIVGLARARNLTVGVVEVDETQVMGVNSRSELAEAEALFQEQARDVAMAGGATLLEPKSVYFSVDTVLGRDVTIGQNVVFGPEVNIGDNVTIHAFSHLEGCNINSAATIGPFARLRPGTDIGRGAKVGNFCEIKKATIEDGAKVSHLSYIGDARVGKSANIGAGTITCNYDGFNKSFTDIGAGAFIGSNTSLIAPVKIGDGAIVGAGSVITKTVDEDALAVVRGDLMQKSGWASKFRSRQKKVKK